MSNTTFNARIKNKRDTAANWEQRNPTLLNGEIILVDTNAGQLRSKIGDGVKTYTQLPFSDEVINNSLSNLQTQINEEKDFVLKCDLAKEQDPPSQYSLIQFIYTAIGVFDLLTELTLTQADNYQEFLLLLASQNIKGEKMYLMIYDSRIDEQFNIYIPINTIKYDNNNNVSNILGSIAAVAGTISLFWEPNRPLQIQLHKYALIRSVESSTKYFSLNQNTGVITISNTNFNKLWEPFIDPIDGDYFVYSEAIPSSNILSLNNTFFYVTDVKQQEEQVIDEITGNYSQVYDREITYLGINRDTQNIEILKIKNKDQPGQFYSYGSLINKYDKTGGDINGNVKVFGNLTLDIEDEDYDSGITFSKALDTNLGTVLTLTGYANNTNYRPVIRNIHDPVNNYDVATKKYVDENLSVPNYHIVFLNLDGTVDQTSVASTIIHSEISAHLTNRTQSDYLDVFWDQTRFYAKCVEIIDINTGDLKFIGEVEFNGMQRYIVFTLTPQNVLTTTSIITFESISNKVTSIANNATSTTFYPTTKAVFDEFQRKPVTIWETDGIGLVGLNTDMSANPNWQLTNLDFSPFKRVKIYTRAAQKSGATASASTTPAIVLEMSLDARAAGPYGGHYIGSYMGQKPNDANRLFTVTCAISADKTSFAVIRMTTLYGTAATDNSDVNAYVFKIEGYYD